MYQSELQCQLPNPPLDKNIFFDIKRSKRAYAKYKARHNLIDFIELDGAPIWKRARHLELLCKKLEQIELGTRNDPNGIKRLIVTMPPRSGKSYVISRKFPAWFLGRNPDYEIVLATYGAQLAQDHSEVARDTFREWGPLLWGVSLNEKSQARDKWKVANHRGGMNAVGVGGALTGRGAHLLIIDDPVKDAAEGLSSVIQDRVWNWWQSVAYMRLAPTASIVILMTRWSRQDLVGRLLKTEEDSDSPQNWEVLNLPEICEEDNDPIGRKIGEVLWPERFPLEWVLDKKANTEHFWWEALWQQRPIDMTSQIFKSEDMHLINPKDVDINQCKFFGSCDPSEGGNDYAAIVIVAVTPSHEWLVWHADLSVDNQSKTIEKLIKLNNQYNFIKFWIEQNSLGHAKNAPGKSVFEIELINSLNKINKSMPYSFVWNSTNKIDRIRALEPYYTQGKLKFRSDYERSYKQLIEQLQYFPLSKHDDGPDALEMCISGILKDNNTVPALKIPKNVVRLKGNWNQIF